MKRFGYPRTFGRQSHHCYWCLFYHYPHHLAPFDKGNYGCLKVTITLDEKFQVTSNTCLNILEVLKEDRYYAPAYIPDQDDCHMFMTQFLKTITFFSKANLVAIMIEAPVKATFDGIKILGIRCKNLMVNSHDTKIIDLKPSPFSTTGS